MRRVCIPKILLVCIGWVYVLTLLTSCAGEGSEKKLTASVRSPDGQNSITLERGNAGGVDTLAFAVARGGRTVIGSSSLIVLLDGLGSIGEGVMLLSREDRRLDEDFSMPVGKCGTVRDLCSEARLRLKSASGVTWDLELRAYNDGVAFRYGFPGQDMFDEFTLLEESTEFRLAGDPTVLFTPRPNFTSSHENLYRNMPFSKLPGETLMDQPFLAVWPDGLSAALTEARLREFAGMYLERIPGEGPAALRTVLSPLPFRPEAAVIGRTPMWSPWRVVLLADQAGKHLESSLLLCLNDPPSGDFSWLRPGKSTWHWWDGTADEQLPIRAGMSFDYHRNYIDFCARSGIVYHAIIADDRPWYRQSKPGFAPGPETDILNPCPELDLSRILEYAAEKGVGIRLWVHWQPLDKRLEEAFSRYEEWGISGLMVDFLDRNDQEMVRFCERVLESAARHRLHIQFHGSYMPSGEQRTFPNLTNREGALNLEYLKWSDRCTPGHNVNVAYTRALAGPTDYHLGGFRAVSPHGFQPQSIRPRVLGTRCHHLALYVVYENWMPVVCDTPSAYSGQTGFDFIKEVPTTWDETRFLTGQAGESVVVARRKGAAWWIGGMTNETGRELEVPLTVLGPGEFEALLYLDGSMSPDEPNAIRLEKRDVTSRDPISVALAPGGGFTAVIRPKDAGKRPLS